MIHITSLSTNDRRVCDCCSSKAVYEINFFNGGTRNETDIYLCDSCKEELADEL